MLGGPVVRLDGSGDLWGLVRVGLGFCLLLHFRQDPVQDGSRVQSYSWMAGPLFPCTCRGIGAWCSKGLCRPGMCDSC